MKLYRNSVSLTKARLASLLLLSGSLVLSPVMAQQDIEKNSPSFNQDGDALEDQSLLPYKDFIENVGAQIIQILVNKSVSLPQREEAFRAVLRTHFDLRAVAKFVLGRYWRQASDSQKEDFLKLFEDSIVHSYAQQFENYNDEKLDVKKARSSGQGVLVTSHVVRPKGAPPLQVDWKVYKTKKGPLILDVIVNGVSMSHTYRTEYGNAYNANGGTLDGLLAAMKANKVKIGGGNEESGE